ncbi:MAG: ERCC4 domain-containing protein [Candidatus Hadarchaeum sp.]|uniref:ERCC4 domain-containing protein n=1 Tax=Candidatus Hadarchaeum sp. TaxID=2883567 RepID=UPI003D142C53
MQSKIDALSGERLKIIADHREEASGVINELRAQGVELEIRQLKVGDFILSDRVGVERKSVSDFLQSIVDKRLMPQARVLRECFERPVLIIEGKGLYHRRAIHPNAIRGTLAALAVDVGIPIIPTVDEKETASILIAIARREQIAEKREVALRGEPKKFTLTDCQRYIVEGLPGVSAVLAKRLLEHFGTVEKIMCASEEELRQVDGIGKEKAREIRNVLTATYAPEAPQQTP